MSIYLYNTLTRKKEELRPLDSPLVKMYVCGMTVQDRPHIGHMRAYVVSDILKRWLTYRGLQVKHIQNFTDIDDKVIEKSLERGEDYRELAEKNIEEYMLCSDLMGIERADFYPRATKHIQEIIELVTELVSNKKAYITSTGVYFDISTFPEYGKLSGKKIEDLKEGARVSVDETKRSPLDFVLWKFAKKGEPYWDSPWGRGRPGWHIECSAMAMKHLGETIDIHTGGEDLIFPHHENEITQSEAITGKPFSNIWVHNGLLQILGDKMSKSTGQFIPALDVFKEHEPDAVRLFFLSSHYRHPLEYTDDRLKESEEALSRIRECVDSLVKKTKDSPQESTGNSLPATLVKFWQEFENAMDDDINTPKAIGKIYSLIREINLGISSIDSYTALLYEDALKSSLQILGIRLEEKEMDNLTPSLIRLILDIREMLRNEKRYDLADKVRESLSKLGITIKDTSNGSIWSI